MHTMARSLGVSFVVVIALVALFAQAAQGAPEEIKHSHRRDLKIFNLLTNRGWGVEGNLGLGFKYKAYGGKVNMGPFTFKKNEAKDMGGLTILEELFPNLFG